MCNVGRISITLDMQDTLGYRYLFLGSSYRSIVFKTTQKSVLHKVATKWKKNRIVLKMLESLQDISSWYTQWRYGLRTYDKSFFFPKYDKCFARLERWTEYIVWYLPFGVLSDMISVNCFVIIQYPWYTTIFYTEQKKLKDYSGLGFDFVGHKESGV